MRYLTVAIFVAFSFQSFAQNSAQYRACNEKAKTQIEINDCANQEATRVDAELNRVYAQLLAKAATEPGAAEKIKTAEKAWVTYRDAYIEAMYPAEDKQIQYGSIYPMEVAVLRAKLTQRQVVALKELLGQYRD